MRLLIHQAMIWSRNYWGIYDILLEEGRIVRIQNRIPLSEGTAVLDASQFIVLAGRISHVVHAPAELSQSWSWKLYANAGITTLLIPRIVPRPYYDSPTRWLQRERVNYYNLPFSYQLLPIFPLHDVEMMLLARWKKAGFTHFYLHLLPEQLIDATELARLYRFGIKYNLLFTFFSLDSDPIHFLKKKRRQGAWSKLNEHTGEHGACHLILPDSLIRREKERNAFLPYLSSFQERRVRQLTRLRMPYLFFIPPADQNGVREPSRVSSRFQHYPKPFPFKDRIPSVRSWIVASSFHIAQAYGWEGKKGVIRHGADAELLFFRRSSLLTKSTFSDNLLYRSLYSPEFIILREHLLASTFPHWPRGQGEMLAGT